MRLPSEPRVAGASMSAGRVGDTGDPLSRAPRGLFALPKMINILCDENRPSHNHIIRASQLYGQPVVPFPSTEGAYHYRATSLLLCLLQTAEPRMALCPTLELPGHRGVGHCQAHL